MKHTQFIMLGMTGTGKTCYLLGTYKKLLCGKKGFSITTDDDTDLDLRRRYDRISDCSLGTERFPQKTNQPEVFKFSLNYAYSPIMSFDWIDYPGGALNSKTDGDTEQYELLKSYIRNASSLFICIDGTLLQGDKDNSVKSDLIKEKCSSVINPFLGDYLKDNNILPPTGIIITKWDLCEQYVTDDDLNEIISEAFSPLFIAGNDTDRFVTILPVTMGKNITENDNRGQFVPENVQLPVYMGIWCSLMEEKLKRQADISIQNRELQVLNQKLKEKKASFFSWFKRDEIANLERESADRLKERDVDKQLMQKAMHDANLLMEELQHTITLSYFNGERSDSFSKASADYLYDRYLDA